MSALLSTTSSGATASDIPTWVFVIAGLMLLSFMISTIAAMLAAVRIRTRNAEEEPMVDVAVLMLAFEDTARAAIQRAMDDIASDGDTGSDAGLVAMLREAIEMLRSHGDAWTHAAVVNASPMPSPQAEAKFEAAAAKARSRFEVEVVRNADGETTRTDAPDLPPTDEPGRVVVTFVVAAERELKDAERSRAGVDAALDGLLAITPDDFVALEVIWSPADENDRMSLDEMTERYPELFAL